MKLEHFRAFVWLRWRLFLHQMLRGGAINTLLHVGVVISAVGLASVGFVLGFAVGWGMTTVDSISPTTVMYAFDVAVVVFLFTWMIGLLSDLQRSEALALDKFLHLPVSLSSVFVLNYLSSLFSMSLTIFVATMIGLLLGMVLGRGPLMLLGFPLIAAFFLMVTALTCQFQGWLAALMANKKRRRTVVVVVTLAFMVIFLSPNLVSVARPWDAALEAEERDRTVLVATKAELLRAQNAGEITAAEVETRYLAAVRKNTIAGQERNRRLSQTIEQAVWIANVALPLGWLAFGMKGLAEGDVWPALFGTLGMSAIGAASLWRAYRTTMRIYTGVYTAGTSSYPTALPVVQAFQLDGQAGKPDLRVALVERTLPGLSEQAAAIALAGLRSLTRAPEAKMLLIMPIIMVLTFGGIYLRGTPELPDLARPFIVFGAMTMIVLSLGQLAGNQFGFDRSGFRAYVLSPVPRRDILLGKNLAIAPIAMTLCVLAACFVQGLYPMRIDRFLALMPQLVSMFLVFCMLANWLSIITPMQMPTGALKPTNANLITSFSNMLFLGTLTPALGTTLLPIGIELGLETLGVVEGVPIALPLSLLGCALVVAIYRAMVTWQGAVLQAREQRILEIVTTKAE